MKILVIDDEKMVLDAIAFSLRQKGYEVTTAIDCRLALGEISIKKFDLIISDIMMPNMSGLMFLNLLKEFYFSRIPVILVSSLHQAGIINMSLSLGASDFIKKPIDFSQLASKIKKIKVMCSKNK